MCRFHRKIVILSRFRLGHLQSVTTWEGGITVYSKTSYPKTVKFSNCQNRSNNKKMYGIWHIINMMVKVLGETFSIKGRKIKTQLSVYYIFCPTRDDGSVSRKCIRVNLCFKNVCKKGDYLVSFHKN